MTVNPVTGDGYSLDQPANYYVIKVDRVYTAAKVGGMTDLEVVFGEDAGLSHGALWQFVHQQRRHQLPPCPRHDSFQPRDQRLLRS